MQSLAEFMAESFNSNVPLTWDLSGVSRTVASFTVDLSVKATVTFERHAGPWPSYLRSRKGDSTEIAQAFAIWGTGVFQAVAEFIEVREPETLVFATKRDELANIYQTYLRKWSARIEELGYRLDGPIRVDPYTEFMLTRERTTGWKA